MIGFIVPNPEEIFNKLYSRRLEKEIIDKEAEMLLASVDENDSELMTKVKSKLPTPITYSTSKFSLPEPLNEIKIYFSSNGYSYSALASIWTKGDGKVDDIAFEKISKKPNWNKIGNGLVYTFDRKVLFNVAIESGYFVKINLGKGGSARRFLNQIEPFETDMNVFGEVITDVVNGFYSKPVIDIDYEIYLK